MSDSTSLRSPSSPAHSRARYAALSSTPSGRAASNSPLTCCPSLRIASGLAAYGARQPRLRDLPVAVHLRSGDAEDFGRLLNAHPEEVTHLDQQAQLPVYGGQPLERLVHGQHLLELRV